MFGRAVWQSNKARWAGCLAGGVAVLGLSVWDAPPACAAPSGQPEERAHDGNDDLGDIDLLALEVPTVVTAARRAQKISHVPYAISVVTAEDIRASGARTVADALRLVPGMDVAELSSAQQGVSPRGLHGLLAVQLLVLVDGRQIFDAMFGGTLWGVWPFQLEDIDRIEVIHGPGGVTWGANAASGVVNIITKDPRDQQGLTLATSAGSRGFAEQYAGYGGTEGPLRYRFSADYRQSDGYLRPGSGLGPPHDGYKAGSLSLHAVYDASSDESLTLSIGSGASDGGLVPMPLGRIGGSSRPGSEASYVMGTWVKGLDGEAELRITGYANDCRVNAGIPMIDYRYQQMALQLGYSLARWGRHQLSWGVDTRFDQLDTHQADPHLLSVDRVHTGTVGLYVKDRLTLGEAWWLDAGARVDWESYGGLQPSARVALSHAIGEDTLLYGAVARAFQMPAAARRFLELPLLGGLVHMTAGTEEDPQTLFAYEVGCRSRFTPGWDVSASVYWHEYADLTTLSLDWPIPGLIHLHNDNRADASLYGVELGSTCQVTDRLKLRAHYTYQHMDWRSSVAYHDKDLNTPPEHKCMLGIVWSPDDDWHVSTQLHYVDEVVAPNAGNRWDPLDVDGYMRLDVRSEHEFCDDKIAFAVGVRNLLDSLHLEGGTTFMDSTEVPRIFYAELRIRID